ncbi:hypothetical protein CASFOL_034960 [Castilleja foliolosa]|uniref:Uncharacterized protein n=1 Tax=Castilleja foliolosa TaxID=1961234 RepID=A0ABD3BRH3_9LAMI
MGLGGEGYPNCMGNEFGHPETNYQVINFFAPSSRFGTPDDLKSLVDKAHELGLVALMVIVHRPCIE